MNAEPQTPKPGDARARLLFAGGTLAVLAIVVVAVLVFTGGGGEDDHEFTAAPQECVDGWNDDVTAVNLGVHQFSFHHYSEVQVLRLTKDLSAEAPASDPTGLCAVAFAASELDAELAAAGMYRESGTWYFVSEEISDPNRLAELQAEAKDSYNANISDEGRIEPL